MIRLDVKHFFLIKLNVRTESGILIFIPLLFICHYQMSLTFVISSLWFVLVSLCSCFFSTLSPHASPNRSRWLAGSTGGLFLLKGVFSFLLLPSVAHRVSFLFWHFKTIVHSDWRWDLLALTHLIPNSTLCQCVLLIMFKKKERCTITVQAPCKKPGNPLNSCYLNIIVVALSIDWCTYKSDRADPQQI